MFVLADTTLINVDRCDAIRPSGNEVIFFYNEGCSKVRIEGDVIPEYMKIISGIQENSKIVELDKVIAVDATGEGEDDIEGID